MKNLVAVLLGAFLLVGGAAAASAGPITYTFAGTASGNLGGSAFTNLAFAIAIGSSTSSIEDCGSGLLNNDSFAATISISSFRVATFVTPTAVFDNQHLSILGFSRAGCGGSNLFDFDNAAFATYNLKTSFGPLFVGTAVAVNQSDRVLTTEGFLDFSSVTNTTFTATTAAVPEPDSLLLVGGGLLSLAGVVRRRLMLYRFPSQAC